MNKISDKHDSSPLTAKVGAKPKPHFTLLPSEGISGTKI